MSLIGSHWQNEQTGQVVAILTEPRDDQDEQQCVDVMGDRGKFSISMIGLNSKYSHL